MQFNRGSLLGLLLALLAAWPAQAQNADIVFVTQVPNTADFANTFSTFGNQLATLDSVPRGGDLWIRYQNGTFKNLTQAAGYGTAGQQGAQSIAVRDPAVHWNGAKVIFSMVIGSPTQQYQLAQYRWQLYEITNMGPNETPLISKVPNQPSGYNNVMPAYGTDDRIIFATDRPRNGEPHLYPQRDEYESTATNSGLWSLNPASGDLFLLDHAPSGAFHPSVDSFGRVIYTRWDHLQRDQQADGTDDYGAFNFSGESAVSVRLATKAEVFPEPRSSADVRIPHVELHSMNIFMPWQINEDGSELETINHIGRHELQGYFNRSFDNDPNLEEHNSSMFPANQNPLELFLQITEDPLNPGRYFGIRCPEFGTHAAGQVVALNGPAGMPADQMTVEYLTHPDTASYTDTPAGTHTGLYRNPLPLADGTIVVTHTASTRQEQNQGSTSAPQSRYDFRLRRLVQNGAYYQAGTALTSGISKQVSYWNPDVLVSHNGPLWELQPVELRARTRPARRIPQLDAPENAVFSQLGVSPESFQTYLRNNNLALIVGRNVTTRDEADIQQPFNLRIPSGVSTTGAGGKVYDVSHLQIFQGDLLRGYSNGNDIGPGRRVLAQPLHDTASFNPPAPGAPSGAVRLAADGSFAAIVPARRALSWQLTSPSGDAIVRERLWLTFQPGEIRVCASCHGINSKDQAGSSAPQNPPQALSDLIKYIRNLPQERAVPCDFDGDKKSDFAVARGSGNLGARVYLAFSNGSEPATLPFGNRNDDLFLAGDVDRDRLADLTAVRARRAPGINWFARESSSLQVSNQPWGILGDLPLLTDIDGDQIADKTVFRPSDGSWWSIRTSLGPISLFWGLFGDLPAPSDYDGDGWEDIAIWRPNIAYWAVLQSSRGASPALEDIIWKQWGLPGDHPMPGDYDGDGKSDLAVWRPSDGTWYVCASGSGFDCAAGTATQFGLPGDIPIGGDFDGDGKRDPAVWRPANGSWYIRRSSDGLMTIRQWGLPGDLPFCAGTLTQAKILAGQ